MGVRMITAGYCHKATNDQQEDVDDQEDEGYQTN